MSERFTEPSEIEARLARIEREHRRLKRIGASILVIIGAMSLMAQAQGTKTVNATQFNLRDSSGRIRGSLFTSGDLTSLNLYGPEGANGISDAVVIENGPQGPSLMFTDKKGKMRMELAMEHNSPSVTLLNSEAEEVASFVGAGDVGSLHLGRAGGSEGFDATVTPAYGPYLILSDGAGFRTAIGTTDLQTPRTGETHRTSAASVILFGKDKSVLWSAP